jgi:Uma2 family endonuclease
MKGIVIDAVDYPLVLDLGRELRLNDEELFELCVRNSELRIERTAEGDLIVMTPAVPESSHRSLIVSSALHVWAERDGTGFAFDSSAGFVLPNTAMRAPDACWITKPRLASVPAEARKRFWPICPDFVVEVRSPSDRLRAQQAKMEEWRDNGARLGWLIDPEPRRVYIYRPGAAVEILDDATSISGDPELPGFMLDLTRVWKPI